MFGYNYKYQNYLRNHVTNLGPLYTAFVVALELQLNEPVVFESKCCMEEMAMIK
jgi:hypothetical protein